ncbi:MAG: hypothetical protein Q8R79_02655 [Legionellaceae bacterium]|nr:hypothetical protein [Legionellaceae bacterium]
MIKNRKKWIGLGVICLLQSTVVWAAAGGGGACLAGIAGTVETELSSLTALMSTVAYVTGFAFAVIGILKLKAHKDNPQQTQLSQPLMMLAVAGALVSFPYVLGAIGTTLFSAGATTVSPTGVPIT